MRTHTLLLAALALISCCLGWSSALFWKSWKSRSGYTGAQNYGGNYYGNGYGNPSFGEYGYGNSGYGSYAGEYGYNYPTYSPHSYPAKERKTSGPRQGRTYSQIARVLKPDGYVGLGGSRFLPRTPYSPLWG
ncbi:hypothetical protein KR018_004357 [Drosophila ironensis]|nr:hypothetical protein KR018_004357 [Drosophila ironensis]